MKKIFRSHRLLLALFTLLALAAANAQWVTNLENRLYSGLIRIIPSASLGQDVVVLSVDEKSNDPWPWSEQLTSRLIKQLDQAGVAVQAYLLPFDYPSSPQQQQIQQQIKHSGSVLLSARADILREVPVFDRERKLIRPVHLDNPLEKSLLSRFRRWVYGQTFSEINVHSQPSRALSSAADDVGLVEGVNPDLTPGELLFYVHGKEVYPSLSLLVAGKVFGQSLNQIRLNERYEVSIGRSGVLLDQQLRFYPYPPSRTHGIEKMPVYPAMDVLNGKVSNRKLKSKAVIIGDTNMHGSNWAWVAGDQNQDRTRWTAYSIQSMLNHLGIWRPVWGGGVQKSLILVFLLYFFLLPRRYRLKIGLVIGTALFFVFLNVELVGLLVYQLWLPLAYPALFLLVSHVILALHDSAMGYVRGIKGELSTAKKELAENYLNQGKLDDAFASFKHCIVDDDILQELYHLAIEFERRRQFTKAIQVYEHISRFDPNYRDVKERRERHFASSDRVNLIATLSGGLSDTLVVDDPNVAQPVLGRYQIIESIGKGAMGAVFLGKDPKIGRTVAIKTLPLSKEFDTQQLDEVRRRFLREAETAGRLSHPNIVTIYDVGEEHDLAYIAMDYVDGDSLDAFTRPGYLLSVSEVFQIGIAVAEALEYAHEQSVVHRDIKPGNVMYSTASKTVKVTDFGIACLTDNSRTMTGTVLGSPSYMSPEQLEGKRLDGRSDLFSLGVTLYQLFTGQLPFNAESMASLAYKIANEKPKSVRKIRGDLPMCLVRIINKALEKDVRNRYQHGGELADALRKCAPKY